MPSALVWFDDDLRLRDHPALHAAAQRGGPLVPVTIHTSGTTWSPGAAQRWWRHHSLAAFDRSLRSKGSRLTIRSGDPGVELRRLAGETGADAVYWNERFTPGSSDAELRTALDEVGVDARICAGRILHNPDRVRTTSDGPYHVFTPFWRRIRADLVVDDPFPPPSRMTAPPTWPRSVPIDELGLLPETTRDTDFRACWTPGEAAAQDRLEAFLDGGIPPYDDHRDLLACDGTSRLSPYLARGEIGIRDVWARIAREAHRHPGPADAVLRQLAWREFSYHLLYHYPGTTTEPLKTKFEAFQWTDRPEFRRRWQQGRTGYPVVDAGMRQLWATGWMHNRARMVTASFLTKDLRQPWQAGARWFWDTLVDADLANNTMGWQWSAGTGADAQPFFRIFNPVKQGKRFDPEGRYIRRWLPELRDLPNAHLHAPWEAPEGVLSDAGVEIGTTYPAPVVDHAAARKAALAAYESVKYASS